MAISDVLCHYECDYDSDYERDYGCWSGGGGPGTYPLGPLGPPPARRAEDKLKRFVLCTEL